jgi:hypothetical protein
MQGHSPRLDRFSLPVRTIFGQLPGQTAILELVESLESKVTKQGLPGCA